MSAHVERLDFTLAGKEELIIQLNKQLAARGVEHPIGPAAEGDAVTNVLPSLQTHLPPMEDPQEPEYPLTEYSLSPSSSLLSIPHDTQNLPLPLPTGRYSREFTRERVQQMPTTPSMREGPFRRAVHR